MDQLSPDELQEIMNRYSAWAEELGDHYLGGQRLESRGALLTAPGKDPITDGPFLESKEIIAGFFRIQAHSQEEANALAASSPHLGLYTIEVRPIAYPKMS